MARQGDNIKEHVTYVLLDGKRTKVSKYEVRWRTPDGKGRSKTFHNKREAQAFQANRKAEVLKRRSTRPDDLALKVYADKMLANKRAGIDCRPVREATITSYTNYLERYAYAYGLDKYKVGGITRQVLRDYVAHLSNLRNAKGYGLSPSTIAKAFIPVRLALAEAVKEGVLDAKRTSTDDNAGNAPPRCLRRRIELGGRP